MMWNHRMGTEKGLQQRISEVEKRCQELSNGVTYCGDVLADHSYRLDRLSDRITEMEHFATRSEIKLRYLLEKQKGDHPQKIVQVVLDLRYGDAIGNDILAIHRTLKKWGYDSRIYANHVHDKVQETAEGLEKIPGLTENDIMLFHFGGYCGFADVFGEYECKKVLVYHNITPASFFPPGSQLEEDGRRGREQLIGLRDKVDFCIAISEFNKRELEDLGFSCPIYVLPILLPFGEYEIPGDENILKKGKNQVNLLHVGRIVPNKKIEDILGVFSAYRKKNPRARLILAGGYTEEDDYYKSLWEKIQKEQIKGVFFTGHIRFEELVAYYRTADVYLCLSEHEGFCVPLLEASFFGVPIIAYRAAAVPDTLAGAGVLLEDKSPKSVAAVVDRIMRDGEWREQLVRGEKERLADFSEQNVREILKNILRFIDSTAEEGKR